jgi:hypothetical protein
LVVRRAGFVDFDLTVLVVFFAFDFEALVAILLAILLLQGWTHISITSLAATLIFFFTRVPSQL